MRQRKKRSNFLKCEEQQLYRRDDGEARFSKARPKAALVQHQGYLQIETTRRERFGRHPFRTSIPHRYRWSKHFAFNRQIFRNVSQYFKVYITRSCTVQDLGSFKIGEVSRGYKTPKCEAVLMLLQSTPLGCITHAIAEYSSFF